MSLKYDEQNWQLRIRSQIEMIDSCIDSALTYIIGMYEREGTTIVQHEKVLMLIKAKKLLIESNSILKDTIEKDENNEKEENLR